VDLTIETKCWGRDWRWVLDHSRFNTLRKRCGASEAKWILWVNNGAAQDAMAEAAEGLKKAGLIDEWGLVSDHAVSALTHFKIDPASFKGGYNYSIAELVGLYRCGTPYLLHFAGDTLPGNNTTDVWLPTLLQGLRDHPEWAVVNLSWDGKYAEVRRDAGEILEPWAIGYGFSDQMYLVRSAEFKAAIYNETHVAGQRYPAYGGNLFEKRVDAYMRNHRRLRATLLTAAYEHKNYPKTKWQSLFWTKNWG
jgi:hypothetical protein